MSCVIGLQTWRNDSFIDLGCDVWEGDTQPAKLSRTKNLTGSQESSEKKWDMIICNLCQQGTDSIHDMRVVNTDALTYQGQPTEKCLQTTEKYNKRKYLEACLQQQLNLSPFVVLVDGLLGVDTKATLKRLDSCLATKWNQPYYRMWAYVNSRIAITLVWSNHYCIQGYRLPERRIIVKFSVGGWLCDQYLQVNSGTTYTPLVIYYSYSIHGNTLF